MVFWQQIDDQALALSQADYLDLVVKPRSITPVQMPM